MDHKCPFRHMTDCVWSWRARPGKQRADSTDYCHYRLICINIILYNCLYATLISPWHLLSYYFVLYFCFWTVCYSVWFIFIVDLMNTTVIFYILYAVFCLMIGYISSQVNWNELNQKSSKLLSINVVHIYELTISAPFYSLFPPLVVIIWLGFISLTADPSYLLHCWRGSHVHDIPRSAGSAKPWCLVRSQDFVVGPSISLTFSLPTMIWGSGLWICYL